MSSSIGSDWVTASIKKLQADMRTLRRDVEMVREAQKDLPTVREFQAGLTSLDTQVTGLADEVVNRLTSNFEAALAARRAKPEDRDDQ